jgi:hypothetical protein
VTSFAELRFRENRFAKKKSSGTKTDYALMSQVNNGFFGGKPLVYADSLKVSGADRHSGHETAVFCQ